MSDEKKRGRKAENQCTACLRPMAKAKMRSDGGDGLRCKPPHGCAATADPPPAEPAKPASAPAKRATRKGTPERTHCKICNCDDGKPCDLGAGRHCVWTDSAARGAAPCSLCAELIENAEELLRRVPEPTPQEVIEILAEDCEAPCVGDGSDPRIAACVAEAIARRKTPETGESEPTDEELRGRVRDILQASHGQWIHAGIVANKIGGALPFARIWSALLAETEAGQIERDPQDRGSFRAPAPPTIAWSGQHAFEAETSQLRPTSAPVSVLDEPCDTPERGGCGAAIGEPCAFTPREPASWAHAVRFERWASREDREALRRWGLEDRILAELDRHAALPGDPPVPSDEGLVRSLIIPGEANALELRERVSVLIERGAVVRLKREGFEYLRRAALPEDAADAALMAALLGTIKAAVSGAQHVPTTADTPSMTVADMENALQCTPSLPPAEPSPEAAPRRPRATVIETEIDLLF